MITDYTTYDAIRAVLGVSVKEVKDTILELSLFETQFLLEMSDVDGGVGAVMAQYATVKAITPTTNRSTLQQQLFDIVSLLAAYSVARQLLSPVALAVPQKIGDGKAVIERFNDATFDKVRDGVMGHYGQLMRRLRAVLVKLVPSADVTTTSRVFIATVGLGTDPVTGT